MVALWVQTLGDMLRIVLLAGGINQGGELEIEPDVHRAQEEGVMSSALVELVCEALGSSGRDPKAALVA